MDFSRLSQNEKLATYGSLAVIVGALVGLGAAGLGFIAVLAALGMLVVIFLPQLSPATQLPGSRGSLMVATPATNPRTGPARSGASGDSRSRQSSWCWGS